MADFPCHFGHGFLRSETFFGTTEDRHAHKVTSFQRETGYGGRIYKCSYIGPNNPKMAALK